LLLGDDAALVVTLFALTPRFSSAALLRVFKGSVVRLFRHPCGSAVAAEVYDSLPAAERNALVSEFYSRESALLGGAQSAAGRLGSLVDAWEGMDGPKRRGTMKHLIGALSPIIEKAYVDPAAIHRCARKSLFTQVYAAP
jgi:hypothetical protein